MCGIAGFSLFNFNEGGETSLEAGTFSFPIAKWSYLNNNGGSTQIDYLFIK